MSGHPSVEGVKQAVQLMDQLAGLSAEVLELRVKAARLLDAEEEYRTKELALRKLLESMDLMQAGNFGYAARLSAFLKEMRRQVPAQSEPVVHQGGDRPGFSACGQPMDSHAGSIVNCPDCWRVFGWCVKCGCPPERGPCGHEVKR